MSERVARELRRHTSRVAAQAIAAVAPNVDTALHNEGLTRRRVEALERTLSNLTDYAERTELLAQDLANWRADSSLWGRLRWLLTGR
jgi:hypothetical protein